jgi:hypothetical protein
MDGILPAIQTPLREAHSSQKDQVDLFIANALVSIV